ncbi:hypothetical protein [Amycolatopsis keratiniphila]|uniref:hypothetical protein n=1 Tax=Amycolatopsis keratiniphila TaxID=129921 RepID=UPI00087AC0BD|nr:hypothetical protein [Amycolatopsis keratiniphila]OLZ61529.1 hypothetical protein BS330_00490 [Amycolatopsis keratiniphila subsp. nogabecina]SDU19014.1 hypothetical protein SAMN04489733_1907 [Amycolatopsis keratiniphila]
MPTYARRPPEPGSGKDKRRPHHHGGTHVPLTAVPRAAGNAAVTAWVQRQQRPPATPTRPAPVGDLTNTGLLDELETVRQQLARPELAAAERQTATTRQTALEQERQARVDAGQVFLAEQSNAGGRGGLLAITDGSQVVDVGTAPLGWGRSAPAVVVTQRQFQRALTGLGIPITSVDEAAAAGVLGPRLQSGAFERQLPGVVGTDVSGPGVLRRGFTGDVSELSFAARQASPLAGDLNAVPWRPAGLGSAPRSGNYPVWDFTDVGGRLVSVKASTQAPAGRGGYYRDSFRTLTGAGGGTAFDRAVWNQHPTLPWPPTTAPAWQAARQDVIRRGRLAVNADDVTSLRATVSSGVMTNPANHQAAIEAHLAVANERVGGTQIRTLAQLNALPPAQRTPILTRLARALSEQVVSHGMDTAGLQSVQNVRLAAGLGGSGRGARPDIAMRTFPEALSVAERGAPGAMGRAGVRSGTMGAGAAVLFQAGGSLATGGGLPSAADLGTTAASTGVGAGIGGAVETRVGAAVGNSLMAGGAGRVYVVLGRAGTSAAGAVVAAPLIETGHMAIEELRGTADYNATDYAARGGRAAASGLLAAGITGAIVGAPATPLGAAVGFLVGVAAYMVTDYLIGDAVESTIRGR